MKVIKGDLIKLAIEGQFDVIIHGCNCFCTMGAGIAKAIRREFDAAYAIDCTTAKGDRNKLGNMTYVTEFRNSKPVTIVNAYTQFNYGRDKVYVDYNAVENVMKRIKDKFTGKRIGYPMIGYGMAGGDWVRISKIIDKELDGEDHTLVKLK